MTKSELETLKHVYEQQRPSYERLGTRVVSDLKDLIENAKISTLDITTRPKTWQSALEKIEEKKYSSPITEIEDWCGVRVICYYLEDIEGILEIIRKNFFVLSKENVVSRLSAKESGYRSTHLIIQMRPKRFSEPVYQGLQGLKVEIQVRTVLMHAWAEIHHKLAYKSSKQVPKKLERQFHLLSSMLEVADAQFDNLRHGIEEYKLQLEENLNSKSLTNNSLDLESFLEFLKFSYPDKTPKRGNAGALLDDIQKMDLGFQDLQRAVDAQKQLFELHPEMKYDWSAVGALRNALFLINDELLSMYRALDRNPDWYARAQRSRDLLSSC